jgi:hypothetical protein
VILKINETATPSTSYPRPTHGIILATVIATVMLLVGATGVFAQLQERICLG